MVIRYLWIIFLYSLPVAAIDQLFLEQHCAEKKTIINSPCHLEPFTQDFRNVREQFFKAIPEEVSTVSTLLEGVEDYKNMFQSKRDSLGNIQRFAKGLFDHSPEKEVWAKEWDRVEAGLVEIEEVQTALHYQTQKLNVCYKMGCGPQRRVELETEREKLEVLKGQLISLSPWWIGEDLPRYLEEIIKKPSSTEKRKELFIHSTALSFQAMSKLEAGLNAMRAMEEDALSKNNEFSYTALLPLYSLRYPEAYEFALKQGISRKGHADVLCKEARTLYKHNSIKKGLLVGAEFSFLAASLFVFPEFSLLQAPKIAKWLSGAQKSRTSGMIFSEVGFASLWINDLDNLQRECRAIALAAQLDEKTTFTNYQNCLEEKQEALQFGLIASFSAGSLALMPRVLQRFNRQKGVVDQFASVEHIDHIFKKTNWMPIEGFSQTLRVGDQQYVSFYNLSSSSKSRSHLSDVPNEYWDYVADIYSKQLNLSPQEIRSFVETSREFAPRTKVVTMTTGPPKARDNDFSGGIAMVESRLSQELLPLEKSTGIKLERSAGKSVEIVRLTATNKSQPRLMKDLLKSLATVVKNDQEIETLYVYTSKAHERLYNRLGLKGVTQKISDRDVVIEIKRDDFLKILEMKK